mgnify:CR=1 FL=1|tara:strand:- start:427 stop:981 length:555 start_codon:yes stop_codon:yes gene_type:complete
MTSHSELPRQKEIEQAVLGAMMIDKDALKRGLELLSTDFFLVPHAVIYNSMEQLDSREEQVNQLTVGEELTSYGALEEIGGHEYLAELAGAVATGSNMDLHCKAVMQAALIDRLEEIGVTPMGPIEMATNTGPPYTSIPVMIEALCEILVHEATIRPETFPFGELDNLAGAILKIRKLIQKKGE